MPAGILSTGIYLPENIVTNSYFERIATDEWIQRKLGIVRRRYLNENETTSDLAAKAAQNALSRAEIAPEEVDLIILATSTPDMPIPPTSCIMQGKINALNAAAFDVMGVCSGFNYALAIASKFISGGDYRTALIVAAEAYSRFLNFSDKKTCTIFGDGAGAVVLKERREGIILNHLGSDGRYWNLIKIPAGGSVYPASHETVSKKMHTFQMDGRAVRDFAINLVPKVVKDALCRAHLGIEDCQYFIFHQANINIVREIMRRLDISEERTHFTIQDYGNTASASIPITLHDAVEKRLIRRRDIIVLVGFGGGLSWGVNILEW